jgi:hypothetical protein
VTTEIRLEMIGAESGRITIGAIAQRSRTGQGIHRPGRFGRINLLATRQSHISKTDKPRRHEDTKEEIQKKTAIAQMSKINLRNLRLFFLSSFVSSVRQ